jgi:hypothetical protein
MTLADRVHIAHKWLTRNEHKPIGRHICIGAAILAAATGTCDYTLYRQFQDSPNPVREVLRWPYNQIYAELDSLSQEYKLLQEEQQKSSVQSDSGRIQESLVGEKYFQMRTRFFNDHPDWRWAIPDNY